MIEEALVDTVWGKQRKPICFVERKMVILLPNCTSTRIRTYVRFSPPEINGSPKPINKQVI